MPVIPGQSKTVPIGQLVYAVGEVETGGIQPLARRYTTVNSIGATGRYQVMKANIPSWTKEALGRSYTLSEWLASPDAQDKTAAYFLGKHQKKYGSWQSAAAVWFSGQPNPDSTASDGGNTVRQYVDKVKKFLTGTTVDTDGTAAGGAVVGAGFTDGLFDTLTKAVAPLADIGAALMSVGKVAELLLKLALPSTWVRIVCGLLGAGFLLFGLIILGRESRGT